ncbi:metallophosphoesterase [Halorhodospira halochloris]|uniref:metallophosphoesterase n=1 Tax=Halorhodospira halochloris TaxID=1052 RepID=UPI001EE95EDA|nr:metallophosphoesterase [Halorhodospira halochloris]
MAIDIIGDIHGELAALERLLSRLGYRKQGGTWRHPECTALFLGDLIDRGPYPRAVVDTVRRMVDAGNAYCLMGNHELNAIAYHTRHPETGEYLRPHTPKNRHQHAATLRCYANYRNRLRSDLDWFKTLPLWLELEGLRAVHAAWEPWALARLQQMRLQEQSDWPQMYPDLFDESSELGSAVDRLLKGIEWPLPEDARFTDKDGHSRNQVRVRWWDAAPGKSWQSVAFVGGDVLEQLPDAPVTEDYQVLSYPATDPPVFVGHYWLTGTPKPLAPNIACLDYSVAKGGALAAYRFTGEQQICEECFEAVQASNVI